MKKQKNIQLSDNLFVISLIVIVIFLMFTLIKGEKLYSTAENRVANTFAHFTINNYLNGEYQTRLEKTLADQVLGSDTIKLNIKSLLTFVNYNNINSSICNDKYVYLDSDYYMYDCKDYMLKKSQMTFDDVKVPIEKNIKKFNKLNNKINSYYYFISTSLIYDFKNNKYNIDVPKYLENSLTGNYKFSSLEFTDIDEYSKYFYKTDHHWNRDGSYKGYVDIIKMIYPNESVLTPVDEIDFNDIYFYGSSSRLNRIYNFKETFKVYKFDYPNFKITINKNKNSSYGNEDLYFSKKYSKDKLNNHYGNFYGGDAGEIIIDTEQNQKENILIISNSFSSPIKKLIASHFNKTNIIDLRYYKNQIGEDFNIYNYIEENKIQKVLFVMDYNFLADSNFDLGQEN